MSETKSKGAEDRSGSRSATDKRSGEKDQRRELVDTMQLINVRTERRRRTLVIIIWGNDGNHRAVEEVKLKRVFRRKMRR